MTDRLNVQDLPYMTRMSGANYHGRPSLTDLEFESIVYNYQFLTRTQLMMGKTSHNHTWEYGIVDENDPASVTEDSVRPLNVRISSSSPWRVDIVPGIAITRSGHLVAVTKNIGGLSTPNMTVGDIAVVYLTAGTLPVRRQLTLARVPVHSFRDIKINESAAVIDTLADFQLLTETELDDVVVLAILTRTSTSLQVDRSYSTYAWNRPWFSPVDRRHRTQVGSGVVTNNNPHGMSIADLTYRDFTVLDLMMHRGCIIAKDRDVPGIPGHLCYEQVASASVKTDILGLVTGVPLTKYFYPSKRPYRVVLLRRRLDYADTMPTPGMNNDEDAGEEIVSLMSLGEPYVAIPMQDSYFWNEQIIEVAYLAVNAGSVDPQLSASAQLTFNDPSSDEVIITEGQVVETLTSPTVNLSDCSITNKIFEFWVDSRGVVHKNPEVMMQATETKDLSGGQVKPLSVSMAYPFHFELALTNPDLSGINLPWREHHYPVLKVEVSGQLLDGSYATKEVLAKFAPNRNEYADFGLCMDESKVGPELDGTYHQFFMDLENVWLSISSFSIKENVTPEYISPNSQLIGYGRIAHNYGTHRLTLGMGWWNGQEICKYIDLRHARTFFDLHQAFPGMDAHSGIQSGVAGLYASPTWAAPLNIVDGHDFESFINPRYRRLDWPQLQMEPLVNGLYHKYLSKPIYVPIQYCTKILVYPVGGATFGNRFEDFVQSIEIRHMNVFGQWSQWADMNQFQGDRAPYMLTTGPFRLIKAFQIRLVVKRLAAQSLHGLIFSYYQNALTPIIREWLLGALGGIIQNWINSHTP